MKIIQVTPEELTAIVEEAVRKAAAELPKRRERPYTKKEVKELFEISYPTLDVWSKKGLLERITVSGRVYYSVESVENLYKTKS